MRWAPGDRGDIQDARGSSGMRMGSIGIGGFLVLLLLSWATGTDFLSLLGGGGGTSSPGSVGTSGELRTTPEEERVVDFVGAVAKDTQDTWEQLLGNRYQRTRVVLFRDAIESACGFAQSATGPFYCPSDQKFYLDLGFFDELSKRFGAPGDFAEAYVIAHEFGHHVQNLLGTSARVQQDPRPGATSASVALELQADCYAGVWGHAASKSGRFQAGHVELEPGDADEALHAAGAIGDDRLQRMATGRVAPERFTHGSSAQRIEWFKRGMSSGDPRQCDTFARNTTQ
jgi:predicted metalloprotease